MALPGEDVRPVKPPTGVRIAIGETYFNEKVKKELPRKIDHFRACHMQMTGKHYVVNEQWQDIISKLAGVTDRKPTRIPIRLVGNPTVDPDTGRMEIPREVLFARTAFYWGNRCRCSCEDAGSGHGKATWHNFEEKKATGQNDGEQIGKDMVVFGGEVVKHVNCCPATCKYFLGTHGLQGYEGKPICVPQVIFGFSIPELCGVGELAIFKTRSWRSHEAIKGSLLWIAAQTGGWLHELPYTYLVLRFEHGKKGPIPVVRVTFEPPVNLAATKRLEGLDQRLLQLASAPCKDFSEVEAVSRQMQAIQEEADAIRAAANPVAILRRESFAVRRVWMGQEEELKRLQAGLPDLAAYEELPALQEAWNSEFVPETVEETGEPPFTPTAEPEPDTISDPVEAAHIAEESAAIIEEEQEEALAEQAATDDGADAQAEEPAKKTKAKKGAWVMPIELEARVGELMDCCLERELANPDAIENMKKTLTSSTTTKACIKHLESLLEKANGTEKPVAHGDPTAPAQATTLVDDSNPRLDI